MTNIINLADYRDKKESDELKNVLQSAFPDVDLQKEARDVFESCKDFRIKPEMLEHFKAVKVLVADIFPNSEVVLDQMLSSMGFFSLDIILKDESTILSNNQLKKFIKLLDMCPQNYNIRARERNISISFQYEDVYELTETASRLSKHLFKQDFLPPCALGSTYFKDNKELLESLYDGDFEQADIKTIKHGPKYVAQFSDIGIFVEPYQHGAMQQLFKSCGRIEFLQTDEWKGMMQLWK